MLQVSELKKTFGDIKAVDGLNITVNKGNIYGLLGVNGSGKSTTLRLILNLINPDSGSILIEGSKLTRGDRILRKRLGALIERPDFYQYLTAYKNLEILMRYSGLIPEKEKILETLKVVGLEGFQHKKVGIYSQGMKQRLGIAQSIIHDPELIILDEPFNGLDPQGIVDIRKLIIRLNRDFGKTIILSSHLLREVEMISDRMLIMNEGKTIAEGNVNELLHSFASRVRIRVSDTEGAFSVLQRRLHNKPIIRGDHELICEIEEHEIPDVNRLLIDNSIDVLAIIPERNLEDYFMSLV